MKATRLKLKVAYNKHQKASSFYSNSFYYFLPKNVSFAHQVCCFVAIDNSGRPEWNIANSVSSALPDWKGKATDHFLIRKSSAHPSTMGPDWSIADSDEFEEMDNSAEEEAIENSEIYESQNLKRIFAPHSLVNGVNKIKVKCVMSSQDLDESGFHEEGGDKEYRSLDEDFAEPKEKKDVKNNEEEEEKEEKEEEEEEEEEEDDGDESYREGQVFKSLLMLAR